VFRSYPRKITYRTRSGTGNSVLLTDNSIGLDGPEYKVSRHLAQLITDRLSAYTETRPISKYPWLQKAFLYDAEPLTPSRIHANAFPMTAKKALKFANRIRDVMGTPPLELTFRVLDQEPGDDCSIKVVGLTVWDARVVDRAAACRAVAVLFLSRRLKQTRYFDKAMWDMLACMVWATRRDDCWEPAPPGKKTKPNQGTAKRYRNAAYEADCRANNIAIPEYSDEEVRQDNDSDEEEGEESGSFSVHEEESSNEDD